MIKEKKNRQNNLGQDDYKGMGTGKMIKRREKVKMNYPSFSTRDSSIRFPSTLAALLIVAMVTL